MWKNEIIKNLNIYKLSRVCTELNKIGWCLNHVVKRQHCYNLQYTATTNTSSNNNPNSGIQPSSNKTHHHRYLYIYTVTKSSDIIKMILLILKSDILIHDYILKVENKCLKPVMQQWAEWNYHIINCWQGCCLLIVCHLEFLIQYSAVCLCNCAFMFQCP